MRKGAVAELTAGLKSSPTIRDVAFARPEFDALFA
jgi:hypothetical protein